jgi:pyruvate/2-oxoglutarate dehydrogenase complex dihydrolipoamide acyltransferase (E2) component
MRPEVAVPLPNERIQTYYFLQFARRFSPVYLTTDVDMTAIVRTRGRRLRDGGRKISYVSFLVEQAARVLARYPDANASVKHGRFPTVMSYGATHAKITVDKLIGKHRVVVPALIQHADRASLEQIQDRIEYFRDRPFDEIPELDGIRALQKCPRVVGQWLFNTLLSRLARRGRLQGTFAVTSLGHRPIHAFLPLISATVCFGMGAVEERPAVIDGAVRVRPVMTLSMAFDHAAIDGGVAADLLSEVKIALDTYRDGDGGGAAPSVPAAVEVSQ